MRSLCPLFLALSITACSGTDEGTDKTPPTTPDTSVFDNCVDFATRLCTDAEGCVDSFKRTVCHPGADAVAAGKATFDEASVAGCLEAHAAAHAVCIPTW